MLEVPGYSDFKTELVTLILRAYWELPFCILRAGISFTLGRQWLLYNQYPHCTAFLETANDGFWKPNHLFF